MLGSPSLWCSEESRALGGGAAWVSLQTIFSCVAPGYFHTLRMGHLVASSRHPR